MKKFNAWALAALLMLVCLTSCTSTSLPAQLPSTMREACSLYQTVKPEVIKLRQYAKDNWPAIPAHIQETLTRLDGYLPALDRAGVAICGVSGMVDVGSGSLGASAGGGVQWDDVLSTVLKAATLAAELKTQGVL